MSTPHAALLVSAVRDYNPDAGPSYVWTFAGTESQMDGVAHYYERLGAGAPLGYGYKTQLQKTAAGVILTVRIPDAEIFSTRWELETEVRQVPLFWSTKIRKLLGPPYDTLDLSKFLDIKIWVRHLSRLQQAVALLRNGADPDQISIPGGTFKMTENDARVVLLALREGDYTEWLTPSLKRVRVISAGLFESRTRLSGAPLLYSLDGIYNNFGLTDDVYAQAVTVYNGLPEAEADTMWSWKQMRNDSVTLVGSGKVQEARSWSFGRWNTINNTFVV